MKGVMKAWYRDKWLTGLGIEERFWLKWVELSGMDWKDDFNKRLDPLFASDKIITSLIPENILMPVVLDAGSGPLSAFPKLLFDGRKVQLHAVDYLAKPFSKALKRAGIQPLVEVIEGNVENLEDVYPKEMFDLIFMRNTLDHVAEPCFAIESMLTVLKPGGCIFLAHRRNLGDRENYDGSAIWNIDVMQGHFYIWSKGRRINVSEELQSIVKLDIISSDEWIDIVMRKNSVAK